MMQPKEAMYALIAVTSIQSYSLVYELDMRTCDSYTCLIVVCKVEKDIAAEFAS